MGEGDTWITPDGALVGGVPAPLDFYLKVTENALARHRFMLAQEGALERFRKSRGSFKNPDTVRAYGGGRRRKKR